MTEHAPRCIGIIMDGNRRWAKEKGLASKAGHTTGFNRAKDIARHAFSKGVDTVMYYAFSTENWRREPEEVSYLMELFARALVDDLREIAEEGIRIRFIGDLARLPSGLQSAAACLQEESATGGSGKTLVIALSYGGRAEIVAAANKLIAEGASTITEDDFAQALWTAGIPDPDVIIRTGGEMRLSNFLPWESTYSELFFTPTYWPDFSVGELDAILAEYAARERRHGK